MPRKSNQEIADAFRELLTKGAKELLGDDLLAPTKAYRAALWRAFAEVEDRLDPLGAIGRKKARGEEAEE
jgi:hypothetical protein